MADAESSEEEEEEMLTPAQIMALRSKMGAPAAEETVVDRDAIRKRVAGLPGIPVMCGKEMFDYVRPPSMYHSTAHHMAAAHDTHARPRAPQPPQPLLPPPPPRLCGARCAPRLHPVWRSWR